MSETTSPTTGTQEESPPTGADALQAASTYKGRYIPYGGGSLGWFENSGVLKCEKGNNYKFHTAIDSRVIWNARVGKRRLVWNMGIGFIDITAEQEAQLKEYLLG